MSTPVHLLARDTYACLANSRLVFSDLRADRYSCLSQANTKAALRLFPAFQSEDEAIVSETHPLDYDETRRVLAALDANGLLAADPANGKTAAPVRVETPTHDPFSDSSASASRATLAHKLGFLEACMNASAQLRFLAIRRVVRRVEIRKHRRLRRARRDDDALHELTAVFHRLRPYYVRAYLCRFDSLALIEFLAHFGHYPQWVFGVATEPFGAHCWVQARNCVLNDSIERVRQYTPIMVF